MFRDEIVLELTAGRGGDGCMSFRRERGVPKGGPDGGDGGRGGNVVLRASEDVNSLLRLGRRKGYSAGGGQPGLSQKKTGRDGDDLVLDVPVGTQVFDAGRGNLLRDLERPGMELNMVDPFARRGFRARGTARYLARGTPEFDAMRGRFDAWGALADHLRGIVVMTVTHAAPVTSPAYDRGATEAELRAQWEAHFRDLNASAASPAD